MEENDYSPAEKAPNGIGTAGFICSLIAFLLAVLVFACETIPKSHADAEYDGVLVIPIFFACVLFVLGLIFSIIGTARKNVKKTLPIAGLFFSGCLIVAPCIIILVKSIC